MPKVLKYFVAIFGVVAALAVAIYVHFWITTVTLVNNSGKLLSPVQIKLARTEIWRGEIPAGKSQRAFGKPNREGNILIFFRIDGRAILAGCSHVAPGPAGRAEIFTIGENGLIDECQPRESADDSKQ